MIEESKIESSSLRFKNLEFYLKNWTIQHLLLVWSSHWFSKTNGSVEKTFPRCFRQKSIFCLRIIDFEVFEVWTQPIITEYVSCAPRECIRSCSRDVFQSRTTISSVQQTATWEFFSPTDTSKPQSKKLLPERSASGFCYSLGHRVRPSHFCHYILISISVGCSHRRRLCALAEVPFGVF